MKQVVNALKLERIKENNCCDANEHNSFFYIPIGKKKFFTKQSLWKCPKTFQLSHPLPNVFGQKLQVILDFKLIVTSHVEGLLLNLSNDSTSTNNIVMLSWQSFSDYVNGIDSKLEPGMSKKELISMLHCFFTRHCKNWSGEYGVEFDKISHVVHLNSLPDCVNPDINSIFIESVCRLSRICSEYRKKLGKQNIYINDLWQKINHLKDKEILLASSLVHQTTVQLDSLIDKIKHSKCEQYDVSKTVEMLKPFISRLRNG